MELQQDVNGNFLLEKETSSGIRCVGWDSECGMQHQDPEWNGNGVEFLGVDPLNDNYYDLDCESNPFQHIVFWNEVQEMLACIIYTRRKY